MIRPMNYCSSKFRKSDLHGKKVALHLPPELTEGKSIGVIANMRVDENTQGEVWIIVDYGFTEGGQIIAGKMELGQDWVEKLNRNGDPKIPAEFIIPKFTSYPMR